MSVTIARFTLLFGMTLLTVSAPAAAQSSVQFGTLAGPALTSITDLDKSADVGMDFLKSKNRLGLQGGLFARIPVKGALSLQPEVHYSQKGGKLETRFDLSEATQDADVLTIGFRLAYVEIPVLARLDLGRRSGWHPFVTFGPSFSLRSSCAVSLEAAGAGSISTGCDEGGLEEEAGSEGSDPFSKTDIGGIAGVGLTGSLLGRSVFAQVRYSQGFSTIARESTDAVSPRNRGFSVVFGLGF